MSKFIHIDQSASHPGVERLENAVSFFKSHSFRLDDSRALAAMLVTAVVAALLVVANQVIDTITDGHLFAAWIGLWAIGFAVMALLTQPAFAAARALGKVWSDWRAANRLAAQDEKMWDLAKHDPRVMADIWAAASLSR
ncbi:MAG: hypothetical protein EAZ37_10260 [Burkholderiales bacterium]|nr:MAG: hypothetical protein EAZ37_10260 [Burkholderiales bacterium]